MFCKSCGNKLSETSKFCTKCGKVVEEISVEKSTKSEELEQKWWYRLAKVLYVGTYFPLLILIPLVWIESAPYYSSYYREYRGGSYGEAFWYSLLTLVAYVVVVRLIKISFLYIALVQKPEWKKEFKKFF